MRNAILATLVVAAGVIVVTDDSSSSATSGSNPERGADEARTAAQRPAAPELTARRVGRVVRVTWRASRSTSKTNHLLISGHDARELAVRALDVWPGTKTSGTLDLPIQKGFEILTVKASRVLDGKRSRVRTVRVK